MVADSSLFVPLDGRIPSQNLLVAPLDGTEVMEIVWPGNNESGNTYQVTTQTLAGYFQGSGVITVITVGATLGNAYPVLTNQSRVLFDKVSGSASYAVCPLASSLTTQDILFKDLKGDAFTNNITVTFSGGELCDGLSSVIINNDYGWLKIAPYPGGGAWYML